MASPNPARSWALATAGLLTRQNEHDHALLGGAAPSPEAAASRVILLARDWNVSTRESLLEALTSLARAGDRKVYDDACALAARSADETHDAQPAEEDDATRRAVRFARRHRTRIGAKSLLAWDTARLVTLAGWGYLAQLLSEDDAWSFILPMAQATQRTYGSWDELGKHCLLGRELAIGAWDPPLARAHLAMFDDAASPWRTLPWQIDLAQHGLSVPLQPVVVANAAAPQAIGGATLKMPGSARLAEDEALPSRKTKRSLLPFVIGGAVVLTLGGVGAAFAFGFAAKKDVSPPSTASAAASGSVSASPSSPSSRVAPAIPNAAPQPSAATSSARPPASPRAPAPSRPPPRGPRQSPKKH